MAKRKPKGTTAPHRFEPGSRVRVRPGVRDPDFPDIPLGGWAGTVKQIHRADGEVTYLIEWDERTLRGLHPIYLKRCERDGLEFERMGLHEGDIVPDEGEPIPIEPPTSIKTQPLTEKDRDDRVRMALGLTHDDPLPDVSHEALLAYHRYLSERLSFPFKARYEKRIGWSERVEMPLTVTGLLRAGECERLSGKGDQDHRKSL